MFEWISGAKNKAADCLSRLVGQLPATPAMINMLTVTHRDGPAFNTGIQTRQDSTSQHYTARQILLLKSHHTQLQHLKPSQQTG